MEKQVTSKIKHLNETNSLDPRLEYPPENQPFHSRISEGKWGNAE